MTTAQLFADKNILRFIQSQIAPIDHLPWLFVHVPETITYAARERIADILQPDFLVVASESDQDRDYDARMSLALTQFVKTDDFRRSRFISGHFKVFQIDDVSALKKSRLFTIMRDPVDRLLADYHAQSAAKNSRPTSQGFLEFAKNSANQNAYLQYLCPKRMWKWKECIDFIQRRFDFIGIAEDLPMTVKMFYAIHGARFDTGFVEKKQPEASFGRETLSTDLIRTISILNAVDYDIFRYFHDRFIALRDDFYQMTDNRELFRVLKYR